jgi:chromosome segregation ATPase
MSSEVVRELFRNFENTLHDRLKVIEDILTRSPSNTSDFEARVREVELHLRSLDDYAMGQVRTLAYNHDQLEKRIEILEANMKSQLQSIVSLIRSIEEAQAKQNEEPVEVAEVKAEINETEEAALNVEMDVTTIEENAHNTLIKTVAELEEEEEEEEAPEGDDEGEDEESPYELIFTFNEIDYYVDKNTNNVYIPDEDGGVDPEDIKGVWNPNTEKMWDPSKKKWWDYKTNKYTEPKAKK